MSGAQYEVMTHEFQVRARQLARTRTDEACNMSTVGELQVLLNMAVTNLQESQAKLAKAREECARLCETHDSSLARLGGNVYDSDRRLLKQRGHELAAAIRAIRASHPSSPEGETP